MPSRIERVRSHNRAKEIHSLVLADPRRLVVLSAKDLHKLAAFHALIRSRTREEALAKLGPIYVKELPVINGICDLCRAPSANAHLKSGVIVCPSCDKKMGEEILSADSALWRKFNRLKSE